MNHTPGNDGKSLRQRRRDRLEKQARERGYTGEWPPQKPTLATYRDWRATLKALESGEHRRGFLRAVATRALEFFEELTEDDMRRMARVLQEAAFDDSNTPTARIVAISMVMTPLHRLTKALPKLLHVEDTILLDRRLKLLAAFFGEFREDAFGRLARQLVTLATTGKSTHRVRAIRQTLKLVMEMMEVVLTVQNMEPDRAMGLPPSDDPRMIRAARELEEMHKQASLDPRRGLSPPKK